MTTPRPSLPVLERYVAERQLDQSIQTVIRILIAIDAHYGRLDHVDLGEIASHGNEKDIALVFCNRFAAVFARLMVDPELQLSINDFERLLTQHRWLDLIFSLSDHRTSDKLMPQLAKRTGETSLTFEGVNFLRFLILRSMNSAIDADLEDYAKVSSTGTAVAFLNYVSSRTVFWPRAFAFREKLLEWLPSRLGALKLGDLMLARLPEIYMHCSYAMTPRKHAIKATLMKQVRNACLSYGCTEAAAEQPHPLPARPTVVIVGENFHSGHAVHRSHSRAVEALRERFRLIGAIHPDPKGTPIARLFEECLPITTIGVLPQVKQLADAILKLKPALILYLGVGMVAPVIALASLRLAPVQCVSFGHTATTMSGTMDYFILPEDFAGAAHTFSEQVIGVAAAAMPFAPRPFTQLPKPPVDGTIRVAVPASTMKLNPHLFEALARTAKSAKSRVEFHFLPIGAIGLAYLELSRAVAAQVPGGIVFPELPPEAYMEKLSKCDLFLCPFPYGNMNGIIDCFRFALPGVCLDGPESHSHADSAFFARVGLPPALATKTLDEYVAMAVRLIDDSDWRASCAKIIADADLSAAFFRGNPALFCDVISGLISRIRQH
jgi:hypothetical protein